MFVAGIAQAERGSCWVADSLPPSIFPEKWKGTFASVAGALTNWFLPNNRNKYFQLTEILATKVFKLKAYFWNKYFRRKTFTSVDEIRVIPLGSGIVVLSLKHFFLYPHPHPEQLPLLPASFLASSFLGKVTRVRKRGVGVVYCKEPLLPQCWLSRPGLESWLCSFMECFLGGAD